MASIRKRRGTFSVVYTYENENGEKKQRWETFKTYAEAHKRRAEIEYKQTEGTFLPPNKQTVADVLKDYVALYGEKTWSYSTFNSNCSMIANYIVPIIGNKEMKEITPREADKQAISPRCPQGSYTMKTVRPYFSLTRKCGAGWRQNSLHAY